VVVVETGAGAGWTVCSSVVVVDVDAGSSEAQPKSGMTATTSKASMACFIISMFLGGYGLPLVVVVVVVFFSITVGGGSGAGAGAAEVVVSVWRTTTLSATKRSPSWV